MAKIDIDKLANAVMVELNAYRDVTIEGMKKAVTETAKQTAAELRSTSPKGATGDYASHWSYKRDKALKGRYKYNMVVHSRKPEYRITHLLEHGHARRNGGRKVKAIPHIKRAEIHAAEILMERLRKHL